MRRGDSPSSEASSTGLASSEAPSTGIGLQAKRSYGWRRIFGSHLLGMGRWSLGGAADSKQRETDQCEKQLIVGLVGAESARSYEVTS